MDDTPRQLYLYLLRDKKIPNIREITLKMAMENLFLESASTADPRNNSAVFYRAAVMDQPGVRQFLLDHVKLEDAIKS